MALPPTVSWQEEALVLIDQRRLPHELALITLTDYRELAIAIEQMYVRGAPAIGVAAAYGLALAARQALPGSASQVLQMVEQAATRLRSTRPTAVNLFWAIDRLLGVARSCSHLPAEDIAQRLLQEAHRVAEEDLQANRRLGHFGAQLLPDTANVLTHCNAGALATAGYGTALGVIRAAREQGKRIHVYVDETRPRLQGARLTMFELMSDGIPCTLVVDGAAGLLLRRGMVDAVIFGADRVAANGDVVNKVGTYPLAVVACENSVPVYCAAPLSTVDLSVPEGDLVPIEERSSEEVLWIGRERIAPAGAQAANPAFDVTPARYITAIITEAGVLRPPYEESLRLAMRGTRACE
jgi:methylthioribose-1-phosphate isomerase